MKLSAGVSATDRRCPPIDSLGHLATAVILMAAVAVFLASPASSAAASPGSITGTVTDAVSHAPVEEVEVCAYRASNLAYEGCSETDASGHYTITELAAGGYKIRFNPPFDSEYIGQYYNGKASFEEADVVTVSEGGTTSNIDAALEKGGHVTGTVTDVATHDPIENVEACAFEVGEEGDFESCGISDSSGEYAIDSLPSGPYIVAFYPTAGVNYISQYYNGKANFEEAEPISVSAGSTTPNINAAMQEGGQIAGTVTDAITHDPIENVEACAKNTGEEEGESFFHCGETAADGRYTISGLPTSSYIVEFYSISGANYLSQYYNGKANFEEAEPISVSAGSTTPNINAAMHEAGKITGTVTDAATHGPIEDIEVCTVISGETEGYSTCGFTNPHGEYTIVGLPTASYAVRFSNSYGSELNYIRQYYNNKASSAEATPVSVTAGSTTQNINAAMQEGGKITGTVTDAITHSPLQSVEVCVSEASGASEVGECLSTDSNGQYTFRGLPTGSYDVTFYRSPSSVYLTQYYNNKASSAEATPVSVTAGSTTPNINAAMQEGGKITGTVTDGVTHDPVKGVRVCAAEAASGEEINECVETDEAGHYELVGLTTGNHSVSFLPGYTCGPHSCTTQNYLTQYYNNKASSAEATPVSVTAGSTTPNINAAMHEGGKITGTVTDAATHDPIEAIEVCAYEPNGGEGGFFRCAQTEVDGEYTIAGIPSGSFTVRFGGVYFSNLNYAVQYFNGKSSQSEATPVSVTAGSTTSNINAAMQEGGKIAGTVTDAVTHSAIKNTEVCASQVGGGESYNCGYTNSSGTYTMGGLSTGSYTVGFFPSPGGHHYAHQYYNGKRFWNESDSVTVTAGATTANINAQLQEGGEITGTVTAAATHGPLLDVEACAVEPSNEEEEGYSCGVTNAAGHYSIKGLAPGSYKVRFSVPLHSIYNGQYYNDKSTFAEAASVSVSTAAATANINAELVEPTVKPSNVEPPELTGTATVGHLLFCGVGAWENSPTSYTYRWLRGSEAIGGATDGSYEVHAADQGRSITCEVTATNGAGSAAVASNSLQIPAALGAPVNTVAPVLSGTPAVGQLLSCANGTWENSPMSYAYAWRRDGTLIAGQSSSSYTAQAVDAGHGISCEVTAKNASGSGSAASNTLQVPVETHEAPGGGGGGGSSPGGSGGGGGGVVPSIPGSTPTKATCKKGFKKAKVKGKTRCIKAKHAKHHHHHG